MSIALNLIVGPYNEPFLLSALESTRALVEYAVLVDTAPGVNPNRDVMESIDFAYIVDMPRESDESFNYSKAREIARINSDTEWILRIDADEVVPESIIPRLYNHTQTPHHTAIEILFWHHMIHPDYYVDTNTDFKKVLFRREKVFWSGNVHEELKILDGDVVRDGATRYNHYGYVRGASEIYKRWQLYDKLGGMNFDISDVPPELCLNNQLGILHRYNRKHPSAVMDKLLEMYPDLGTYPLDNLISTIRENS